MTDPDWADNVKSKLADWNETCNKRIEKATTQLQDALKKYYGFTDDKFQSDKQKLAHTAKVQCW